MRALAVLAARELRAQSPAAAAALLTALLPWAAPLLPMFAQAGGNADVRLTTAAILAALLGMALAVFLGAGLLARDVADGRIAFFLALPLRARTIWSGRLLAAVLLVYGGMALVFLPCLLTARLPPMEAGWMFLPAAMLLPLALLLLAHHAAVALRSRSPWLLADAALLALTAYLAVTGLGRLRDAMAPVEAAWALDGFALLVSAVLAVAGGFALGRGGVLIARVHRAQLAAAAAGLLLAALAVRAYAGWVLHPAPADVAALDEIESAPAGGWIALEGVVLRQRPSYNPTMLLDLERGQSLTLPWYTDSLTRVVFSADGGAALALGAEPAGGPTVWWVELGAKPRALATGVAVPRPYETQLAALGDGGFALADSRQIAVWSRDGQRLRAAGRLGDGFATWSALREASPASVELLRLMQPPEGRGMTSDDSGGSRYERWQLDVRGRRLRRIAAVALPTDAPLRGARSRDGSRVLVLNVSGRGPVLLLDAADGRTVAEIAPRQAGQGRVTARLLADGSVLVAHPAAAAHTLRLEHLDANGRPLRVLDVADVRLAWLGDEWAPGVVPVSVLATASGRLGDRRLLRVDLARGTLRDLGSGLVLLHGAGPFYSPAPTPAGSPGARLFLDQTRFAVVRVADDGGRTPVLTLATPRPR